MSNRPAKSAAPDPRRIAASFTARATLPCAQWVSLMDRVVALLKARRMAAEAKVKRQRLLKTLAMLGVIGAGIACTAVFGPLGIILGVAGATAVAFMYRIAPAEDVPVERVAFVHALAATFAEADAAARLSINAQFDYRRGLPAGAAGGEGKEDAWLEGRLDGLPGLRLAWRIVERPTASFASRPKRRRAAQTRFAMRVVRHIAVRMDARTDSYRAAPVSPDDIEVRRSEGWISVRGKLRHSHKVKTRQEKSMAHAIQALRAKGRREFFAPRPADLVDLMKKCEQQLAPAGARS